MLSPDHLDLTLTALKKNGVKYKKAASVKNLDLEKIKFSENLPPGIPFVVDKATVFLVAVDRDAILVREGIDAMPVDFQCQLPSVDGCNYQTAAEAQLPEPIRSLRIERGFIAIDAKIAGKAYRIFNTHLEVKGKI
ncbi:hypothetical protein [Methylomicrobium sp. Wu6]|uniref:hypothetical protein n=1 Tax=Methylomicrobium sp. Wu6 TaxID=3107928 RepID=UPI002DD68A01|nr:hypothetical protein [Methylomicrobium sp. Wu6]MEC4748895.1 hypothetical protein [Methylomicrobium sp. Wu6]